MVPGEILANMVLSGSWRSQIYTIWLVSILPSSTRQINAKYVPALGSDLLDEPQRGHQATALWFRRSASSRIFAQ